MISPFKLPLKVNGIQVYYIKDATGRVLAHKMSADDAMSIMETVNAQPAVVALCKDIIEHNMDVNGECVVCAWDKKNRAHDPDCFVGKAETLLRQLGGETEQGKCGNCGLKAIDPATERCNECGCDHSREPELGGSDD